MSIRWVRNTLLVMGLTIGGPGITGTPLQAKPYPATAGMCYSFTGETPTLRQPCVIQTGYGAGGHYAVLEWLDGVKTRIEKVNFCPEQNFDSAGFCRYIVDDEAAQSYFRDRALQPTPSFNSDEAIACFKIKKSGNSVCYRQALGG
jgi:hypothetical protein